MSWTNHLSLSLWDLNAKLKMIGNIHENARRPLKIGLWNNIKNIKTVRSTFLTLKINQEFSPTKSICQEKWLNLRKNSALVAYNLRLG
jgi:hypothetical protein